MKKTILALSCFVAISSLAQDEEKKGEIKKTEFKPGIEYTGEVGLGLRKVQSNNYVVADSFLEVKRKITVSKGDASASLLVGGVVVFRDDKGAIITGNQVRSTNSYIAGQTDLLLRKGPIFLDVGFTYEELFNQGISVGGFRAAVGACGSAVKIDACVEALASKWFYSDSFESTEVAATVNACKNLKNDKYAICLGAQYIYAYSEFRRNHIVSGQAVLQHKINNSNNAYLKGEYAYETSTGEFSGPPSNVFTINFGLSGDLNGKAIRESHKKGERK